MKEIAIPHLKRNPIGILAWDEHTNEWSLQRISKFKRLRDLFSDSSWVPELQHLSGFEAFTQQHPEIANVYQRYDPDGYIAKYPHQYIIDDIRRRGLERWRKSPSQVDPSILVQWTNIEHADTQLVHIESWHHAITQVCTPEEYACAMFPVFMKYTQGKYQTPPPHFAKYWYEHISEPHRKAVENQLYEYLIKTEHEEARYTFVSNALHEGWMLPFDPQRIQQLTQSIALPDIPWLEYQFDDQLRIRIPKTWWTYTKVYTDQKLEKEWLKRIRNNQDAIVASDARALNETIEKCEKNKGPGTYNMLISMALNNADDWQADSFQRVQKLLAHPDADQAIDYIFWDRWPDRHTQALQTLYLTPERCSRIVDALFMNANSVPSDNLAILIGSDPKTQSLLDHPDVQDLKKFVIVGLLCHAYPNATIQDAIAQYTTIENIQHVHSGIQPSAYIQLQQPMSDPYDTSLDVFHAQT